MASISNDTDPEGKTKILTVLQLKLPHCNGTDDVTVKVDDGAEGNILPSGLCFPTHSTQMATQNQDSCEDPK